MIYTVRLAIPNYIDWYTLTIMGLQEDYMIIFFSSCLF